jgi:hypothetical protein
MKNIIMIVLLCALSATAFSQESKNVTISKDVIGSFQKNDFTKIVTYFDETMAKALPAESLKQVWNDLNTQCGNFQKFSDITEGKIQVYDVTYILCEFANIRLKMKTVFNDKNQIAGLFFVPENQP